MGVAVQDQWVGERPSASYKAFVAAGTIEHDPGQWVVVERLAQLHEELWAKFRNPPASWAFWKKPAPVQGVYVWGGVGAGKTFLMDIFHRSLPPGYGHRVHFHRFMASVHEALTQLQGEKNPLERIARQWSQQYPVLCFDEFFVSDITDAMLLAGLFQALTAQGVTFVMTSNVEPRGLYEDGLQRSRFLPAIDLIYSTMEVIHIESASDYRLRTLERDALFLSPLNASSHERLQSMFQALTKDSPDVVREGSIEINHRDIAYIAQCGDVLWLDFEELCWAPRSSRDYIALSDRFQTVLLTGVKALTDQNADGVRRFINLVDEFYDRNVKLVMTADQPLEQLYTGKRLAFEFERTQSRLIEMQSKEYLARAHKAA